MFRSIIFILIIILFTSCLGGEQNNVTSDNMNQGEIITLEKKDNLEYEAIPKDIEEVTALESLKSNDLKKIIKIKNDIAIPTKLMKESINVCENYENEYKGKSIDYIKKDIIYKTINHIKDDLNSKNLEDYEKLASGQISGVYKDFNSLEKIEKIYDSDKYNKEDYYFYLANYILFIQQHSLQESYMQEYLSNVKNEKNVINENYLIPLLSTEIAISGNCTNILNENFISY